MFQTLKRLFLVIMTLLAVSTMINSLVASWQQPQIQSRLELYQTNLFLQAAQGEPQSDRPAPQGQNRQNWQQFREIILGKEPIKTAQEQYQSARQADKNILEDLQEQLTKLPATKATSSSIPKTIKELQEVMAQLDISLGILYMESGDRQAARNTWQGVLNSEVKPINSTQKTAKILLDLWSTSPQIKAESPKVETLIKANLVSWFRDRTLIQLYTRQNRLTEVKALQQQQYAQADRVLWLLLIITIVPAASGLCGLGLLLFLGGQIILKGQQSLLLSPSWQISTGEPDRTEDKNKSPVTRDVQDIQATQPRQKPWITPWDGETIWEVLVGGFFFVGQLLIPYIFSNLPLESFNLDVRGKAIVVLLSYLAMSAGTLLVLYFALQRFLPLPTGWFRVDWRGNWFGWGLGGYLAAIPLVIGISLVNQAIWQGKGGSNPILPLALQGNDPWAFVIFSTTASLAAPIFEEIIFRGFLFPSLARYLPLWGAIIASSFLFAIAHLSLSEVLPLTVLGMVLGVVYWRSGNLLASMFLHSLWNSGTLISLYILSSGGN